MLLCRMGFGVASKLDCDEGGCFGVASFIDAAEGRDLLGSMWQMLATDSGAAVMLCARDV